MFLKKEFFFARLNHYMMLTLFGVFKVSLLIPVPLPVTAFVSQQASPFSSQGVEHELQKDLGEEGVTSGHETCTIHVWPRKGNVTGDVSF